MSDTYNITIRPIEKADLSFRVQWINDNHINRTLTFDTPVSLASTEQWFTRTLTDSTKKHFIIEAEDTNKAIGMCGLLDIDRYSRKAEIYITLGDRTYQGKGLSKIALQLLIKYAFNNLGLNRLYLTTLTDNTVAQRLYERLGFKQEGLLRDHLYLKGEYRSVIIYSLLQGDSACRSA